MNFGISTQSPARAQAATSVFTFRGIAAATACAIVVLAVMAANAGAVASTYSVWSCRGPGGSQVSSSAWSTAASSAAAEISDTCGSDGSLRIGLPAATAFTEPTSANAVFTAPAGTSIGGFTLWRALAIAEPELDKTFDFFAGVREEVSPGVDTRIGCANSAAVCTSAGTEANALDIANELTNLGSPLQKIELIAECSVAACDAPLATTAYLQLYRSRVDLIDTSSPSAPDLSGSLVTAATVDESAQLDVSSTDVGGGIAAIKIAIDGETPTDPESGCASPYSAAVPCPGSDSRSLTVDTSGLSDGAHTFSGAIVDAAGNVTNFGPTDFTVDHPDPIPTGPTGEPTGPTGEPTGPTGEPTGPTGEPTGPTGEPTGPTGPPTGPTGPPTGPTGPPTGPTGPIEPTGSTGPTAGPTAGPPTTGSPESNGSPAVTTPVIAIDGGNVVASKVGDAVINGTLKSPNNVPIAGATLGVAVRDLGVFGSSDVSQASIKTTANGNFSLTLRPDGALRVTISFAPSAGVAPTVATTVNVRSLLSIGARGSKKKLRVGKKWSITGAVAGAGSASAGIPVQVQVVINGRWRTVASVRTGATGNFKWTYRFKRVRGTTKFAFRAVVLASPTWPWPNETSSRVRVKVRG